MKKTMTIFLSIFMSCALIFSTTSWKIAIAEDNSTQEQVEEKQAPQKPVIDENMSAEDANKLIEEYNIAAQDYNKYVEEENEKRKAAYDKTIEQINAHNNIERLKVDENTQALEKQEKREQRVISDTISKLDFYTDVPNSIPTSWIDEATNLVTSSVESDELSNNKYKVINLHIFLKDGASETYETSAVTDNSFQVSQDTTLNMLRAEWETFTVDENDFISLRGLNSFYPHNGAIFTRFFNGYTNGYWIPTQEFVCTASYVEDIWNDGLSTNFSYIDGSTDHQGPKNVLNVFTYTFTRLGAEPTKVEKYEPDFLDYPDLELLTPVELMEKIENKEEPKEEEKKEESKEEKKKEEEPKKEEKVEEKKEDSTNKKNKEKKNNNKKENTTTKNNNNTTNPSSSSETTKEIIHENYIPTSSSLKTTEKLPTTGDYNESVLFGGSIALFAISLISIGVIDYYYKKKDGR